MVMASFNFLLGDELIKNDGTIIQTSELSTERGSVIGLYFSAHWCEPYGTFTPRLCAVYEELRKQGKLFEVIFVSSDEDDETFKEYHSQMPWLAIPYNLDAKKDACSERFKVAGLPTLALIDASSGDTITADGVFPVDTYGAEAFPFTAIEVEKCRIATEAKKQIALERMGSLSFLGTLTTIANNGRELEFDIVARRSKIIALAFVKGQKCCNSACVLTKLLEVKNSLGEDNLGIILVPFDEEIQFDKKLESLIKDIPMVKLGKNANRTVQRFKEITSIIETPYIVVISKNQKSSTFKLLADDVARDIWETGCPGFPWSFEALAALARAKEAKRMEFKRRQKHLEFLTSPDELGRTNIMDKNGDELLLDALQKHNVVGLYFAARWCTSCEEFTPMLMNVYATCKREGKSMEIIFISSDRDSDEFEEHLTAWKMPWCVLQYSKRCLKEDLCELYDIQGIPKLVLLTGTGELITQDGTQAIRRGVEYYPWYDDVTGWVMTSYVAGDCFYISGMNGKRFFR